MGIIPIHLLTNSLLEVETVKLYFSTRQIPQLQGLAMAERMDKLRAAENKLTAPEKLLLNICKLLIIVPVFVFILRSAEDWSALVWAGLFILAYPFLLKPFQYSMCAKYLSDPSESKGND
ncbi:MAG: hypothetical protein Alis3KO_25980 [Aliiglaciecola sp.]